MPPETPSRTRFPAYGRSVVSVTGGMKERRAVVAPARAGLLGGALARDDAVVDVALRQLLERLRRELLVARRASGELVQRARILRGDEDAEVLVGGVLGNLDRCEDSHVSMTEG